MSNIMEEYLPLIREGRVLAVDCIKSQPVWMSEMKARIVTGSLIYTPNNLQNQLYKR